MCRFPSQRRFHVHKTLDSSSLLSILHSTSVECQVGLKAFSWTPYDRVGQAYLSLADLCPAYFKSGYINMDSLMAYSNVGTWSPS